MVNKERGNTLALVVAAIGITIVAIGFIVLTYNQFFSAHKEAVTAIDSAALQAAKDMSRITVDSPLGKIALVDDPSPAKGNKYPVTGVNTLVATLRLDALIATQLDNKTMLFLVNEDTKRAVPVLKELKQRIEASKRGEDSAFDKNGGSINMLADAQSVYNNNALRAGLKRTAGGNTQVSLLIGSLNQGSSSTNVPTPSQPGASVNDPAVTGANSFITNNTRFYKADTDIAIPGLPSQNVRFLSLAEQVSLADNVQFQGSNNSQANDLASAIAGLPTCVQATAGETIRPIESKAGESQTLQVIATAIVGGQRMSSQTGTLAISFPQGFPANPTGAKGDSTPLTFNSVKSMMNAAQFTNPDTATPTVAAADEATWNGGSKGVWLEANGSHFPASGSLNKHPFKGINGREFDNPSVALSFMVYDWLRSLQLRPNAKSVVDALSFDLRTYANGSAQPKSFPISRGSELFPAAYAAGADQGILTALLRLNDDMGDPRDLTRWDQDAAAYSRQEVRMWGYLPADSVLPAGASVALIAHGDVTTTDGNPVKDITDFQTAVLVTNNYAYETNIAVTQALARLANQHLHTSIDVNHPETMSESDKKKLNGPDGAKLEQFISKNHPGLDYAWRNAAYCMQVTEGIKNNLKTLTGGGVKKLSNTHYVVMGTDFYPADRPASESQILANKAPTGQDSKAPFKDWCAPMTKQADGSYHSQLIFFKRTEAPVIGLRSSHGFWLPPALAQGAIPANNMLKFMFHLGDPGSPQASVVILHPSPNSPFADVPTGNKQTEYQCTQAIKVPSTSDPDVKVTWQVRARDQHSNHYPGQSNPSGPPDPNSAAKYFTDFPGAKNIVHHKESLMPAAFAANGYNDEWCSPDNQQGCQALAAEFAVTCPVVENPPPGETPDPKPNPQPKPNPPAWSPPPPPPCWATSYFRVEPAFATPGTIWALLYTSCRYYNGCGQLINATHS